MRFMRYILIICILLIATGILAGVFNFIDLSDRFDLYGSNMTPDPTSTPAVQKESEMPVFAPVDSATEPITPTRTATPATPQDKYVLELMPVDGAENMTQVPATPNPTQTPAKTTDVQDSTNNPPATVAEQGEYLTVLAESILEKINQQREANSLKPLVFSSNVLAVANSKAKEMADNDYFDHVSPKTGDIDKQFEVFGNIVLGENAAHIGENLLYCYGYNKDDLSADMLVQGWMDSQGHRENILNADFTHTAISAYYTGNGKLFAVESFYTPE